MEAHDCFRNYRYLENKYVRHFLKSQNKQFWRFQIIDFLDNLVNKLPPAVYINQEVGEGRTSTVSVQDNLRY